MIYIILHQIYCFIKLHLWVWKLVQQRQLFRLLVGISSKLEMLNSENTIRSWASRIMMRCPTKKLKTAAGSRQISRDLIQWKYYQWERRYSCKYRLPYPNLEVFPAASKISSLDKWTLFHFYSLHRTTFLSSNVVK